FAKWRARHTPNASAAPAASDPDNEPLQWSSVDKHGKPMPGVVNARVAILSLGFKCSYDIFRDAMLIKGEDFNLNGNLTDNSVLMLRYIITRKFGFDPSKNHTFDAVSQLCLKHSFDPVKDYLAALTWDGKARIDTWLVNYLGAADNALN